MDEVGVPPFLETTKWGLGRSHHDHICLSTYLIYLLLTIAIWGEYHDKLIRQRIPLGTFRDGLFSDKNPIIFEKSQRLKPMNPIHHESQFLAGMSRVNSPAVCQPLEQSTINWISQLVSSWRYSGDLRADIILGYWGSTLWRSKVASGF